MAKKKVPFDDIELYQGVVLQRLRLNMGLTQQQFADSVGINRSFLSDVQREPRTIQLKKLAIVCHGFGLKPSEFIALTERLSAGEHFDKVLPLNPPPDSPIRRIYQI